ncbi:MAG TPA: thioredoxin family protein [Gammaproteobacteria bacterium]|nr:thioredoxin family protein [Gammaproteobacteria bacterium]
MSYTLAVGENAPNFEKLLATDRKFYSICDINQTSLKVIFFTCNHCPYVTGSDELTRKVAEKFQKEVEFVAINSNSKNTYEEDSYENMVLRMEEFNFPWLYLHDESQKVALEYGALKTPHFFLFDASWKLLYTGRNTDNPRETTRRSTNDLHDALQEAMDGLEISVPVTNPIGCNIKWDGKPAHWMPAEACDLV